MIEIHPITSRRQWLEMRAPNLGASEVAALFHQHPYTTALELWAKKSGRLVGGMEDNAILRRGRLLEAAVIEALQEDHPDWDVTRPREYHADGAYRLGCTPDAFATICGEPEVIQVKVVAPSKFDEDWAERPPTGYLMQLQAEMLLTGRERGRLVAMVADGYQYPVHEYPLEADQTFRAALLEAATRFWECVDQGREPALKPDADGATLAKIYPNPAGDTLALGGRADIEAACLKHASLGAQIKTLQSERDNQAGIICNALRNHSRGELPGWKISWPAVAETSYTVTRKSHRRLTITRVR